MALLQAAISGLPLCPEATRVSATCKVRPRVSVNSFNLMGLVRLSRSSTRLNNREIEMMPMGSAVAKNPVTLGLVHILRSIKRGRGRMNLRHHLALVGMAGSAAVITAIYFRIKLQSCIHGFFTVSEPAHILPSGTERKMAALCRNVVDLKCSF
jgi:hypothetical protein